jgi:preprotein translocase subunit SecD
MGAAKRSASVLALTLFVIHPIFAEPLALEVLSATVDFDQYTKHQVIYARLKPAAAEAFRRFTKENVGRKIEVRIDGRIVVKPFIREPIISEIIPIAGDFTADQARETAERLSSGKSKIELETATD